MTKNMPASAGDAGDMDSIPASGRLPLEKGMATHSNVLAWKNPWKEESGRLQCMELQRVRHDRVTECAHARADTHSEMKELSLRIVKNPIHVVLPLKII